MTPSWISVLPPVLAVGLAFITRDAATSLALACFAGTLGVFGDHVSPLSDTTVLSSLGAACDHIDHVETQLPYALVVAAVASALYLLVGFMAAA